MLVARTLPELRAALATLPSPLGLVPTMGALHDGHASLVRRAASENAAVVATVFVNPAQFAAGADLDTYPRTFEADAAALEAAGAALVFAPQPEAMYPAGFGTAVRPPAALTGGAAEAAARDGHFDGVSTVVLKLFNLVRPARAYFGGKDALQCAVVKRVAADLDTGVDVRVCPTVREPDGLAMSSRNRRLPPPERRAAPVVYRSLRAARAAWAAADGAAVPAAVLAAAARAVLRAEPLVTDVEYVSVACAETMREVPAVAAGDDGAAVLVSVAVTCGGVRLIDNVLLGGEDGWGGTAAG